jgi:uncharacterized protein (DUF58 family)
MNRLSFTRIWLPALALYVTSLFYLLFQGGKTSLMLFVMLNALIIYLGLGRWSGIGRVQGIRTIESGDTLSTMRAGMRLRVRLQIHVPGFWPIPYVIVRDPLIRSGADEWQVYEVSFVPDYRRRGDILYETAPLRRGRYRFGKTECSTRDIFGLFEHQGTFAETREFQVFPRMIALKDWQMLRRSQSGVYQHSFTSKWARETTQIDGVREYIPGDRLSRIHWNATARTGEWKSKEFEREALPRIVLLLDCERTAYRSSEQFELAVSAAASLAELVAHRGMPLGFVTTGKNPGLFGADRMPALRDDVMRHLVDVEPDGIHPLSRMILEASSRFGAGVQIVVVSPQTGEALADAFDHLEAGRVIPSHIHIGSAAESDEERLGLLRWQRLCQMKQWDFVSITRLEDLPSAIGVASA